MHENAKLLERFYKSVQDHDHLAIADCYHPSATFKDIAFDLRDKRMIEAMWRMIAASDLRVSYNVKGANASNGSAHWVADYTFTDTGRKIHNHLTSNFGFRDGLIVSQIDDCDPWQWGMQALGPVKGFFSWLVPAVRRHTAMDKLRDFIGQHPEYQ